MIYGRSILVILFYVVKFIGFSYHAALDPEMGFWVSFFGYVRRGALRRACKARR